jgi:hypothetical protein
LEQWVERGQMRLIERDLGSQVQNAFDALIEDGFSKNTIGFVKDLAVAIFEHQDGNSVVTYSPIQDKTTWKAEFFGLNNDKNLMREASPLNHRGNQYRFIHRSVLEYGLTRAAFEPRQGGIDEQGDQGMKQELTSPLSQTFVHEPSILQFLAERVQQEQKFKQELLDFIEKSKSNENWSIAAANAITILVRAGTHFIGADLNNIRIRGADLSYGQFDSAHLKGADLRDVELHSIWMLRADLRQARMGGVEFGEWPYLEADSAVYCCTYSPDGNTCAFGCEDGSIRMYDTASWTETSRKAHSGTVNSVVYSPNGQQITSESDDTTVRLWDVQTGAPGQILSGHTNSVQSVVYSPNGQQIASGSNDKTVRLWDVDSGQC